MIQAPEEQMVRETVQNLQKSVRGRAKLRVSSVPPGGRTSSRRRLNTTLRSDSLVVQVKPRRARSSSQRYSTMGQLNQGFDIGCQLRTEAAYHDSIAATDVARALLLCRQTVKESREVAALADFTNAYAHVHRMLDGLDLRGERVDTYAENQLIDGSRQVISVELDPFMKAQTQRSAWETIAMKRRIVFHTEKERYKYTLPCLPMAALGSDAGNYWDAMKCHPASKEWCKLTDRLTKSAIAPFLLRGGDKGTGVLKCIAHEANLTQPWVGSAYYPCCLHGCHNPRPYGMYGMEKLVDPIPVFPLWVNKSCFIYFSRANAINCSKNAKGIRAKGGKSRVRSNFIWNRAGYVTTASASGSKSSACCT